LLNVKEKLNEIHLKKLKIKRIKKIIKKGIIITIISGGLIWLLYNNFTIKQEKKIIQPEVTKKNSSVLEEEEKAIEVEIEEIINQEKNNIKEIKKEVSDVKYIKDTLMDNKADTIDNINIQYEPEIIDSITLLTRKEREESLDKETITSINNKKQTIDYEFDCNSTSIYFSIESFNSCMGKATGKIVINNITGGEKPYSFSLNNGDEQTDNVFLNIKQGYYSIIVKDKNGCIKTKEIFIDEEECIKNYKFAPSYGEVWDIPALNNVLGKIQIFNKTGNIVYQNIIYGNADQWDGKDNNGLLLPLGSYKAIIHYTNKEPVIANVTIIN